MPRHTITTVAMVRQKYFQTPLIHRAGLLLDAYLPATGRMTVGRMLKAIRIAKTLARELEAPELRNRE